MPQLIPIALKLLSRRLHTEYELRQALKKQFATHPELDEAVHATIIRLNELNLLNDAYAAKALASHYSHKGNRFISQALCQKGLSEEHIANALEQIDNEYDRALKEARKKIKTINQETSEQIKIKLYRFLSSRGFSFQSIDEVAKTLF